MKVSSGAKKPDIHAGAYVAPNAVVSGEVTIEEGCAVLFGAVISAEGAPVVVGANTVVMENAVLKSSGGSVMQFPLSVGESCIIGPGAYIVGATIEPGCFIAAGERVSNGQTIPENTTVGNVESSFFEDVFNLQNSGDVRARAAEGYAKFLRKTHAQDTLLAEAPKKPVPKGPARKTAEEPPPAQNVEVEKVVDVMFVELEEARLRREAAIERGKTGRK
ncbi:MAG: gamma carbonic anhydrase family protein [Candidatus Baltobacteraceae bacterium]